MIPLSSLKFGTDAEMFLKSLNGQPFPVSGLLGGTKEAPLPIKELGEGFALQEDNAAVEFNLPPTNHAVRFGKNAMKMMAYIEKKLPKGLSLDYDNSSVVFDEAYLQIPELQVFGCEPDFNAFTMQANDRPLPPEPGFRSAAAHVHIGWENPNDDERIELIRLSDVFVTCSQLELEKKDEVKRRELYGKAGAFRFKPYGVEHRVLGNKWLQTFSRVQEVFRCYLDAVAALNVGFVVDPHDYSTVCDLINSHNALEAKILSKEYFRKLENKVGPAFNWAEYYNAFGAL